MDIKLVVVGGKNAGHVIPVQTPQFFIGRGEECQLRPSSDRVSRKHCVLLVKEGRALVRDLKSSNGTFVNDDRIDAERELKTGDKLRVGNLEFEVQLSVSVGGKKKAKVTNVQEAAARLVQSAADDELDVSDWLTHTETIINETQADTQVFKPSYAQGRSTAADEGGSVGGAKKGDQTKDRLFDSAQSGGPKPASASSRQAAEDVLKRVFKGGGTK